MAKYEVRGRIGGACNDYAAVSHQRMRRTKPARSWFESKITLGGVDGQVRGCVGGQSVVVCRSEFCASGAMDLVQLGQLVEAPGRVGGFVKRKGKKR
jgi:hypothetical protein